MNWIGLALAAIGEFFGWKKQKEINKPEDKKREETQEIRKQRDEEINYNADAVRYGVDSLTGRVRYPKDK